MEISFEVFPSLGSSGVSASACVSPESSDWELRREANIVLSATVSS